MPCAARQMPAIRETLAQHGIVNGEVVDSEKLDADPFIQQVMGDVEQISHEQTAIREADEAFASEHLIPHESTFEIDGRRFIVDSVNLDFSKVSLQDVTFQNAAGFPIFRSESIAFMRGLVEISEAQRTAELPAEPQLESETAAFYSAEENNLPFDVEIRTIKTPEPLMQKPELHNFRITDDHLGEGGAKAKFRMNMDAINLLKELEFDGRQATPEEQVILSKYVGWGGLADAFDETKDNWKNEFAELYTTLSPEEYAAARSSTLNAHYTSGFTGSAGNCLSTEAGRTSSVLLRKENASMATFFQIGATSKKSIIRHRKRKTKRIWTGK